jgi:hypothetical protein
MLLPVSGSFFREGSGENAEICDRNQEQSIERMSNSGGTVSILTAHEPDGGVSGKSFAALPKSAGRFLTILVKTVAGARQCCSFALTLQNSLFRRLLGLERSRCYE